jgi:hypothetical protein
MREKIRTPLEWLDDLVHGKLRQSLAAPWKWAAATCRVQGVKGRLRTTGLVAVLPDGSPTDNLILFTQVSPGDVIDLDIHSRSGVTPHRGVVTAAKPMLNEDSTIIRITIDSTGGHNP